MSDSRILPNWQWLIMKSGLPSMTRHILHVLSCHANNAGEECFPSIDLLARETGMGRSSVINHLAKAEAAGYIERHKRHAEGQRWALNEYRLICPDEIAAENPVSGPVVDAEAGQEGSPAAGPGGQEGSPAAGPGGQEGSPAGGSKVVQQLDTNFTVNSTKKYIYADLTVAEKEAFEEIWKILPHVLNDPKKTARQAFAERIGQGAAPKVLVKAAQVYRDWADGVPGHWPCHAAKWLAEERDAAAVTPGGEDKPRVAGDAALPVHLTPDCPKDRAEHWRRLVVATAARHGAPDVISWFASVVFDGHVAWAPGSFIREQLVNRFGDELGPTEVRVGMPEQPGEARA